MSTQTEPPSRNGRSASDGLIDSIKGTRDSMSVRRAYGDAYELDGVTVIPVARVSGGGGGGGGEGGGGEGTDDEGGGGLGFGTGFGLRVNPIGVYEVRGDTVEWKPSIDINRLAKGGQILAGVIAVCTTLVLLARSR